MFFWLGLVCDALGTAMMMDMASELTFGVHGVTGVTVIILVIIHAIRVTDVLIHKNEVAIRKFHKFSVAVWVIWLIPYLSGAVFGMTR